MNDYVRDLIEYTKWFGGFKTSAEAVAFLDKHLSPNWQEHTEWPPVSSHTAINDDD